MTLQALSQKLGVSKSLLSFIELNLSVPTFRTLEKICKVFGATIADLYSLKGTFLPLSLKEKNGLQSKKVAVVRRNRRKKSVLPEGEARYGLSPDLQQKIEFI
jgi:transcriptional regulator with XRE-family HTH domain